MLANLSVMATSMQPVEIYEFENKLDLLLSRTSQLLCAIALDFQLVDLLL